MTGRFHVCNISNNYLALLEILHFNENSSPENVIRFELLLYKLIYSKQRILEADLP